MAIFDKLFDRKSLINICLIIHYIIGPLSLLILSGLFGIWIWFSVFMIGIITILTHFIFKTCLVYEIENYIKHWTNEGLRENRCNIALKKYQQKIVAKPLFFFRFVLLAICFVTLVYSIGLYRGFV